MIEINGIPYREYLSIKYSWSSIRGDQYKDKKNLIPHPWDTGWLIYCFSHKTIEESLQGIQLHLEMVSYYTCGPCGLYADIRGTVADQRFHGRTALTGTYKGRQLIPQIH